MNRHQQIQVVLNNFNFEHVQNSIQQDKPRTYWYATSGEVPPVEELREFARQLLEKAIEPSPHNCRSIECGRFYANRWPWITSEGTDCTLELLFVTESSDA